MQVYAATPAQLAHDGAKLALIFAGPRGYANCACGRESRCKIGSEKRAGETNGVDQFMDANTEISRVAIVGTGLIGSSWATCFLAYGLDVVATDPVRPGLLNLQTEDTFQTLATRDSFGPTVARLMSTHLLAG